MSINVSGIISDYQTVADLFITTVNKSTITLHYAPSELTAISDTFEAAPFNVNMLGGRQDLNQMEGRHDQDGNNYREDPVTEDLQCRVYWLSRGNKPDSPIVDQQDFCKVITFNSDRSKIRNASYAVIDGYQCQMVKEPLSHGLMGQKRYDTSFWEVMSGESNIEDS